MKHFWIGFSLVCVCGLLVALAGGLQWGTRDTGDFVAMTFTLAICMGGVFSFFANFEFDDGWDD